MTAAISMPHTGLIEATERVITSPTVVPSARVHRCHVSGGLPDVLRRSGFRGEPSALRWKKN
jgi:hypothetical protein